MSRSLLSAMVWIMLLSSCASSNHTTQKKQEQQPLPKFFNIDSIIAGTTPLSALSLPQSQDGDIILSEGYYEADFKSYCLQPGTPEPSARDAYTMGTISGYRKDIVETILRNSLNRNDLEQRNIQLLLWSVVSGSDYTKLSSPVKSTARQLLSSKQIFALQGGMMGVVKTIATAFPETGINTAYNDMRQLFELGNSTYEAYESIAVLRQPSVVHRADYKRDQWYEQEGGYYVRYFPSGYQRVKIQIYVPPGTLDSNGKKGDAYLLFDPVTMMAIPANSNAQRLGIGAPVADVIRKIIEIQKTPKTPKKPTPANQNPKGIVLN